MRTLWVVFWNIKTGKELCAYTLKDTFENELESTRELLAYENNTPIENIGAEIMFKGKHGWKVWKGAKINA